jgi:hypothetical protein
MQIYIFLSTGSGMLRQRARAALQTPFAGRPRSLRKYPTRHAPSAPTDISKRGYLTRLFDCRGSATSTAWQCGAQPAILSIHHSQLSIPSDMIISHGFPAHLLYSQNCQMMYKGVLSFDQGPSPTAHFACYRINLLSSKDFSNSTQRLMSVCSNSGLR